jgi:transcriptional regulatory protein LevR
MNLKQLSDELEKLPDLIRTQEKIVIELENKSDHAKLAYDVEYGIALLNADRPNATEKRARATELSIKTANEVIEAKYNLKIAEAELNYYDNRFIALRKIGGLEERLINANISGN